MHRVGTRAKRRGPSFLGFQHGRFAASIIALLVLALALPATAAAATQTLTVEKKGTGTGTVTSSPAGIECGATCSAPFTEGSTVVLKAASGPNTATVEWTGCTAGETLENECKVAMSAAKSVTATFNLLERKLTLEKKGSGTGTVTSSPAGINCGATCSASFVKGSAVTLAGESLGASLPVVWSGCESVTAESECFVTMSAAKAVTATFNLNPVQLTVTKAGNGNGTVASSPAGIKCGATCSSGFNQGSTVVLTGAPGLHSEAVQWTGCTSVNGKGECEVTMSAARSVTATFKLEPGYALYPLTITKVGTGTGTVTSSVGGIDCGAVCSAEFLTKTKVTLTATAAPDSAFTRWGGYCNGSGPCVVTVGKAKKVTAKFIVTGQRTLTISKAGTGTGTVISHPVGINCGTTCSSQVAAGKKVTLVATPASGSAFAGFSGACSGTGSCKVLMSEARSVTATFAKLPTPSGAGTLLVAAKARVKAGKALLKVRCKGPSSCQGSLKLSARLGGARGKAKGAAIGSTRFSLAPGSSTTLKVTLSAAARQLLASSGQLRARVSGTGIAASAIKLKLGGKRHQGRARRRLASSSGPWPATPSLGRRFHAG
jgi:Divergent InlB B-repeat domain